MNPTLEETYWKLVELNGQAVTAKPATGKDIYFILRKDGNKVQGFAGCNGFGGTYELKEGDRIRFSQMISTMMACDVLETENKLMKVFEMADNYNLVDNRLMLNKARMAPLARFEAVKSVKGVK